MAKLSSASERILSMSDEPTQCEPSAVSGHSTGMASTPSREPGAILRAALAYSSTTTMENSPGSPKSSPLPKAPPPSPPPPAHLPVLTASEILPRLYISDFFTAVNTTALHALHITHVISVLEVPVSFPAPSEPLAASRVVSPSPTAPLDPDTQPTSESLPLHLTTLPVPLPDIPSADIFSYFQTTNEFIATALNDENARVLVHCYKGQSRSPTIVAAYLISAHKMSASDALKTIKAKRRMVLPNRGFMRQLKQFEEVVREEDEMVCSEK